MEYIDSEEIFHAVAVTFGVSKAQIIAPDRTGDIADARKAFCYLMKKHGERISRDKIGEIINRGGSSIVHAVLASKRHIESNDQPFSRKVKAAEAVLGVAEKICSHCGQPILQKK